jgi:quinate dehydrogenase (quinone)
MQGASDQSRPGPRPPRIFGSLLLGVGAILFLGGARLALLGGSWYYLLGGMLLVAVGMLLWQRRTLASGLYGGYLLLTLAWTLWEAGLEPWGWAPRLLVPALVGVWFLMPVLRRALHAPQAPPRLFGTSRSLTTLGTVVAAGVVIWFLGLATAPVQSMPERKASAPVQPVTDDTVTDWQNYGNTPRGTRYARLDQITPQNVGRLTKLWTYRTRRDNQFKATPIQVGQSLYFCTAFNVIVALDAENGAPRWEFDPELEIPPRGFTSTCRGVSYYKAPASYSGDCPERILTGTTDARLFAINARTGARCQDFGKDGEISLLSGMGEVKSGFYFVTSPPLIANGLAVVGGWVLDNAEVNEPSGVVRAFNAVTGRFTWAWDMGRPGVHTEPAPGKHYTRGTPNVWSVMSFDKALGLIYAPTGNSTPDYFGAQRSDESEKYASSVVALEVATGEVRWSFQTAHHDIWDYDVPSQPVLVDLPQKDGRVLPALVQATKRGELFVLDRRTGEPLADVKELPVPQDPVPEDFVSATQPFSVGMPQFRGPDLTEADVWGRTQLDQLWCRIEFRKLRYEGHFTPPTVGGSLQFPGNAGGFNWGSVAVDEDQKLLVANPLIMSNRIQMIPRAEVPEDMRGGQQLGTPYGMITRPFMSPLAVPCQAPPYGRLAVVDLQTREVLWNHPIGTTNESGPFGVRIRVPLPMGVPLQAGTLITKGGLIFIGGTMDRYFRAVDVRSGQELWRDYLPGTAQATPMSYRAPRSGRQIVIITVPNVQRRFGMPSNSNQPAREDPLGGYVIAYALPR